MCHPILTLQLKRFRQDDASNTRTKNSTAFDFPLYLDMAPYVAEGACPLSLAYELSAVIVHQGSADEGHYYALVKDEAYAWRKYDDATVTKMKGSELRRAVGGAEGDGPAAYMLLYRQFSDPQLIPQALAHSDSRVMASAGASIPEALATSTSVLVANWENEDASAERNDDDAADDDDDDEDDAVDDVDDEYDHAAVAGEDIATRSGHRAGPEDFSALSPAMAAPLYHVREQVLKIIATAPDPANPYGWLKLPWDPDAPGSDAHALEAGYMSLSPTALRHFLRANAHHLTPACFDKIMGVGRGGDVERDGIYWKSGPTLVATATVNQLSTARIGVWLGACNGQWATFNTSIAVRKLDLFPRSDDVQLHVCDGATPYASPGTQDFVMYACSLPAPSYLPPALRLALLALRHQGTVRRDGRHLGQHPQPFILCRQAP